METNRSLELSLSFPRLRDMKNWQGTFHTRKMEVAVPLATLQTWHQTTLASGRGCLISTPHWLPTVEARRFPAVASCYISDGRLGEPRRRTGMLKVETHPAAADDLLDTLGIIIREQL